MDSVESSRPPKCVPEIEALSRGERVDEEGIRTLCRFVDTREDCSDFRMTTLIRILYQFSDLVSEETRGLLKKSVLGFRYWLDEPGDDSMCIWSENHQMLFSSCEYLAGQYYPDEVFGNNGMTGRERMERARIRILDWLQDRWTWGFIEWHSNVYYEEDLPPVANLIDFAADREIVRKSTIIMDLFLADIAMHSWKGHFNVSSGRCYERQKRDPGKADTLQITEKMWGFGNLKEYDYSTLSGVFLQMRNYKLPEAIRQIGLDRSPGAVRASNGVNLKEMKQLGFDMNSRKTTLFQWAMEAFSNPESFRQTVDLFKEWKLEDNRFLKQMDDFSHPLLRKLLPLISRVLNPVSNGIAIQRANTYTWRTPDYMMSTACRYHPGDFGDQHHIWTALVSPRINVFTTHPAVLYFEGDALLSLSPNNWVGNGRNPHSVQHENIHMSLYELPRRKGFMEKQLHHFTHAYFPAEKFDETFHEGSRIAGRAGDTYIALIGGSDLEFSEEDPAELIQKGRSTWWICLMGSRSENGSFGNFRKKMRALRAEYRGRILKAETEDTRLEMTWKGDFRVNGEVVSTDFDRLDSPWGRIERQPREIGLSAGEHTLRLNLDTMTREEA